MDLERALMVGDVVLIPLIAAAACLLPIGGLVRPLAIVSGLLTTATVGVAALVGIGGAATGSFTWAGPVGAQFVIGGDGWSAALLMLSGIVFAAGAVASGDVRSPRAYFALWSLLQAAVAGVFIARDLIVFFAFWEACLVPLGCLMWGWGGSDRRTATLRLVLYWMTGSALLLAGIVALGVGARTFAFADLAAYRLAEGSQIALAVLFLAAFAVRLPLFPFHAWLAPAYTSASAGVGIVLAGIVSKTAIYAIARVAIPFFPRGMADLGPMLIALATVGSLYGAVLAIRQRDTRAVIAYASLSQLDLAALGVFLASATGLQGALVASVSHGLVVAALLMLAAALARRLGTFGFGTGGLAAAAPVLASLFLIAVLAAIGVPGLSGAPGELLVLASAFAHSPGIGLLATLVVLVSAAYGIGLLRAVFLGPAARGVPDLTWPERAVVLPLLALVAVVGLAPGIITGLAR